LPQILTTEYAACSKPPSTDNHRKAPYSRTQQRVQWVEFRSRDRDYTVAIKTAL